MPSPETIAEALAAAAAQLQRAGLDTPRLDAEVLLRHVLRLDRTALFQRLRQPMPTEAATRFAALLSRRAARVPVAYLIGQREFMGLPFSVAPGVLIPRPATELLVEWALAWPADRPADMVVDVGTGSGAIALSLAAHLPATWQGSIIAADISPVAMRIAATNRQQLALTNRVSLVRGDLLSWCGHADLVLANLPYLQPEQVAENPDLAAEPALALLGGADGLALIRRLIADLPRVLGPGGGVALEIDPNQACAVRSLLQTTFSNVHVHADLAGLPRCVSALYRGEHRARHTLL